MTLDVEQRIREAYGGLQPAPDVERRVRELLADAPQSGAAERRPTLRIAVAAAAAATLAVGVYFFLPSPVPAPAPAPGGADDPAAVGKERDADRAAYEKFLAESGRGRNGGWVVIAGGKVAGGSSTLAEVSGLAPEAKHRFVFAIGPEQHDDEQFVSTWYGPRFAGLALPRALKVKVEFGMETTLHTKDGLQTFVGAPFPRVPVFVASPSGKGETLDVFLGSVGPPLMLTPDDWDRLGLARWEIPGKHTVMGLPCRRARVRVSLPRVQAIGGPRPEIEDAELIASCPAFEREKLVDLARARDAFWNWGGALPDFVTRGREGKWIVFGVDRVLAEGAMAVDVLSSASGKAPEAYHRYMTMWPVRPPIEIDESEFGPPTKYPMTLNGIEVHPRLPLRLPLRLGEFEFNGARDDRLAPTPCLVPREEAAKMHLESTEEAREVVLLRGAECRPTRSGYALQEGGVRVPPMLVIYPIE